jgi:hypothetical protein
MCSFDELRLFLSKQIMLLAKHQLEVTADLSEPIVRSNQGLIRWMRLWSVKSRKFSATTIAASDGAMLISVHGRLGNLVDFWSPIFKRRGRCLRRGCSASR